MRLLVPIALFLVPQLAHAAQLAVLPTQFDESSRGSVPELFDDYLLTAVQNNTRHEVIGQEDIGAMLGFEQQKDLLDCSDTSCIADIGGALGVDRIVVVKIARVGADWIATAKIINIRDTKVEARVNEIIGGEVKDLLRAVPQLVRKLFADNDALAAETSGGPAPTVSTGPSSTGGNAATTPPRSRDPSIGKGRRITGMVLMLGGAVTALSGVALMLSDGSDEILYDSLGKITFMWAAVTVGVVLAGIGTKVRATGVARGQLQTENASGSPFLYWLGWVLAGGAVAMPWIGALLDEELDGLTAATITGTFTVGSLAVFAIGGFAKSKSQIGLSIPLPTVHFARGPTGKPTPVAALAMRF